MDKKNIYYIAILVFIASALGVFLIYRTLTAKEKKIGSAISVRLNNLETVQKHIAENIKSIKNIELPVLRYGYSFNENDGYFISEIISASKKYGVKLGRVKLIHINKNKNTAVYSFKVSGSGKPSDIYSLIKTLEYNYKIELKKFYISKNFNKENDVSFSSLLAAYVISKPEMLPGIVKLKANLSPPYNFGTINPFVNVPKTKEAVEKIERKPAKKITENVYRKLSNESNIKESDFYNKKGVSFFEKNNLNKALAMFKKAVMLNPDNYMALSNAALDSYEAKNYNESIFYARKALNQKKLWQVNFILGLAYLRIENFSEAEHNFKEALKLNPSSGRIKYYLNISKNRR
ncbi:MAG: tetratricopeptide repeat protein [Deltaproteobacteria bacterium]|nr:tetratricopeptide repeat protein [Deltaproteobacteria bacterium]